jgi:hypothetical protein
VTIKESLEGPAVILTAGPCLWEQGPFSVDFVCLILGP